MHARRGSVSRRGMVCLLVTLGAGTAQAKPKRRRRRVRVAEVRSKVKRSDRDVTHTLRRLLERELRRLRISPDGRFLLSAQLVTLKTARKSRYSESRCVVQATLRRERGGALFAAISGRASAREKKPEVAELETTAMKAAVRSALSRLGDAITAA